jgi:2-haloacid dehalogenase
VRLRWVLCDLNGTLLDPSGIGGPLGLSVEESVAAFDDAILASMADTLSGAYRPLPELLRSALLTRAQLTGDAAGIEEAIQRARSMPAYPGAGEAVVGLREAGLEVGVLTNSATGAAERALEAAGLRQQMSIVVGSDQVEVFKPHPALYERGIAATGVEAAEVCMVAAHWWDVLGAARAGMRTAWIAHKEGNLTEAAGNPDVIAATLGEGAKAIAVLAQAPG